MSKFRRKLVIVEAVQLRWDNWNEMCEHAGVGKLEDGKPQGTFLTKEGVPTLNKEWSNIIGLLIPTSEGLVIAVQNDWVIRSNGKLYICKPGVFEETYELVE